MQTFSVLPFVIERKHKKTPKRGAYLGRFRNIFVSLNKKIQI